MMKRKFTVVLLLAFCMSLLAAGCGGNGNDQQAAGDANGAPEGDGSWQRVVDAGKITAGLDDQYEPMGFRDEDGNLTGFDIEMAAAISEKIGVPIEFVPSDWNGIVPSLISKKFDTIISGMNAWADRRAEADFVLYGIADQVILVPADFDDEAALNEQGLEYFLDKKVGTQAGSTGYKNIMTHEGFVEGQNLLTYATFPQVVMDVKSGRLDGMVVDSFGVPTIIADGELKQAGEPVYDLNEGKDAAYIGIACRKEDKELQEKLQQAVDELIADGTISELSMKWIGVDITEGM